MSGSALLAELTPTPEELADFKMLDSVDDLGAPEQAVAAHLRMATAMFILASGIETAPDWNSPIGTLIKSGILDMTWYIGTSMESRDESFSPFSSERIGSYSYSIASKKAISGEDTGVPFFDMALQWFKGQISESEADQIFGLSSEHVFSQPYSAPKKIYMPRVELVEEDETSEPADLDYIKLFEEG